MKIKDIALTDEAVIREALKTVTEYANRHPDSMFNVDECVEQAVNAISIVWKTVKHSYFGLTAKDRQTIDELRYRIEAELRTRARAKAMGVLKSRTVRQINMVTAENVLSEELGKRGYQYHFCDWQQYRVKILIRLNNGKNMKFFVKYKDVPSKVQEILDNITTIINIITQTGLIVTIK